MRITKRVVDAMRPGDFLADDEVRNFVARCLPSGAVTYGLRYRIAGEQRWLALGLHGNVTPATARKLARKRSGEVADDRDPATERKVKREKAAVATASTVNALLDAFLDRHVRKNLKPAREVERVFSKYVRGRIGSTSIYSLRRRDVVEMLDAIQDANGPVMADRVLAWVRKAFNWQATRDDTFVPPIVRGMARSKSTSRDRTLTDEEICAVWSALERARVPKPYPALVRVLLLTGQRLEEVAGMRWEEIDRDGVWTIPATRRIKGGPNVVPLTGDVLQLLGATRKKGFVFTTSDKASASFSGFSKAKAALNATIAADRKAAKLDPLPAWVLHDLRRTARSLMSRAGVLPDTAERVVGHVIPGVRGVYDRYTFLTEKREALEKLAALVANILRPAA